MHIIINKDSPDPLKMCLLSSSSSSFSPSNWKTLRLFFVPRLPLFPLFLCPWASRHQAANPRSCKESGTATWNPTGKTRWLDSTRTSQFLHTVISTTRMCLFEKSQTAFSHARALPESAAICASLFVRQNACECQNTQNLDMMHFKKSLFGHHQ